MMYSIPFSVILDANVLYPAPVRDLFLNLADLNAFSPRWSEIIQDEWVENLLKNRPDLSRNKLMRTVNLMNAAFPDAAVFDFEEIIDQVELPDSNDKHVLAAAIKSEANAILCWGT